MTRSQPLRLLLVEDNPGDANLIHKILARIGSPISLELLQDGESAIDYLLNRTDLPDIVILDMSLPRKNALAVLQATQARLRAGSVVVFVLSGCLSRADSARCRELGATACYVKPDDFKAYEGLLRAIVANEIPRDTGDESSP